MQTLQYQCIHANGVDFNVATAGEGERLALCLHGFPESSFSWRFQIPLLTQLGFRVWAPDLRGFGQTSKPAGVGSYSQETLEADVAALIEASGAKEVVLIGHDWGALIAWNYAMFGRVPIAKLIVMNVPHPAILAEQIFNLRQLLRSWYIFFFQLPWLPEWLLSRNNCAAIAASIRDTAADKTRFSADILRVYQQSAAQPGALTAMVNYYRAAVRNFNKMKKRGARQITIPTLFLWGEADKVLGIECTYGTEKHVDDLTFHRLPHVSHWIQQEAPEQVNVLIKTWLLGQKV